ncbi:MAG: stage II sporulation protein M [Propionibacteriaceae bacterium]|jgi:uncharacterized membrane protein SpoIIM required for sporulation|nr:stage II sporulation protein M [Propionibacteriaceae bacterium]
MDIDVFTKLHQGQWDRLQRLSAQRKLTGREADDLVHLYRQGATHLSYLRSTAPDPALVSQLSLTLAKARGRIASPHDSSWRDLVRFVTLTLPAALYKVRWWSVVTAAACLLFALGVGLFAGANPDTLDRFVDPATQAAYANQAFADYYTEYAHASFTALVWTNNAQIAGLCVATGITGFIPVYVLLQNSFQIGVIAAVMHRQGADAIFYQLILPHGLLELSAVFVAGAAGLRLLWAWLVPGARTRARSLAEEGKTTLIVVVALTVTLLVSGLLEGFVTPSALPWWLKIAVGALACGAFWFVTFGVGRWAVDKGADPGVTAEEAKSVIAVAG